MAYMCKINNSVECDACGECQKSTDEMYTCEDCGCDICDGDDYYDIAGTILCEDCIDNYKFTANSIF